MEGHIRALLTVQFGVLAIFFFTSGDAKHGLFMLALNILVFII